VNAPSAIANCARDRSYQLLRSIAGVCMAPTLRVPRHAQPELNYPLTLRPVDSQGGEGLQRLDDAGQLTRYYAEVPASSYYAARYVDYQSADGLYRKMRIVLINAEPYICHLAIAEHWMVHYQSAGMEHSAARRQEEQDFMEGFEQDFAVRMGERLRCVAQALQLDYVTVDCAETAAGELLVFEVDSRGLIHAADPRALYPYKPAVMQKAFDAFAGMLQRRLEARGSEGPQIDG
jgi:glutathione synthase/RimK-type ligase-like ATP-grasp enzyme